MTSLSNLIPALQLAIGPVILISGVGLLILSMTNRFGRTIDRSRILSHELSLADDDLRDLLNAQLEIMWQRARQLRMAVALASISALSAAFLIIALFLIALLELEAAWLLALIFIACLGSLIASLIIFIKDMNRSLAALKLELRSKKEAVAN